MTARLRVLRLEAPKIVCGWYGLRPYELFRICGTHPGVRVWLDGHSLVDVQRFETVWFKSDDTVHLGPSKKKPGRPLLHPGSQAHVGPVETDTLSRPEHTPFSQR
jgi:hypothetical protein